MEANKARNVAENLDKALAVLNDIYGYQSFRSGQEMTVSAILSGEDVLAIMPTGAGKSVCYQVPAIVLGGLTLVVSPLISLMYDQVMALKKRGVRAAFLNSTLTPGQQETVLRRAAAGEYQIMYTTPERLNTTPFRSFAATVDIPLIAVDEAHCISRWGGDFRPAYARIDSFICDLPRRPVIAAFTATATDAVRSEIKHSLGMDAPVMVVSGFDRPNLRLEVVKCDDSEKEREVREIARRHRDSCGIIYCTTRKKTEDLALKLRKAGLAADFYHGGMAKTDRDRSQSMFISGETRVMVATNAFGMGIDKADVRYVICYNMPASIEDYYQQIGRAGRDGKPALCLMLWNRSDVETIEWFISKIGDGRDLTPEQVEVETARQRKNLAEMRTFCVRDDCLRMQILEYFGDQTSSRNDCGNCSTCSAREHGLKSKGYSSGARAKAPDPRKGAGVKSKKAFEKRQTSAHKLIAAEKKEAEKKRQDKMSERAKRRSSRGA